MDAFAVEQLDFSELQAAMDEILNQSFSFQDTVLALLSGEQPFTMESFLRMALSEAGRSFAQEKQIFISILVLGIAAALLTNFTNLFKNDQIGEISFEMTYLLLFLLLLQIFYRGGGAGRTGAVFGSELHESLASGLVSGGDPVGGQHDGAGILSVSAGPYLPAGYGSSGRCCCLC